MHLRNTQSLCEECLSIIPAEIFEDKGKVWMRKSCSNHGESEILYWSDYKLYKRFQSYEAIGSGIANPQTKRSKGCLYDCGLCNEHLSHTALGIVYITNKCNLRCNICFDRAGKVGYLYEPSLEQILGMFDTLRKNKPVPTPAIQLTGGEPTLRKDLPEIIRRAKQRGFRNVEVNTNGIIFARDKDFFKRCFEAGMDTIYLSFDGLDAKVYEQKVGSGWGERMLEVKQRIVQNAREIGFASIVLVPTFARGINDDQAGKIIRFALENIDIIRCVNFQPIGLVGRLESSYERTTIPDCIKAIEEQTPKIKERHFYPIPTVAPLSDLAEALTGKKKVKFTCHPNCGASTYLLVEEGEAFPLPDFFDIDGFFQDLRKNAWKLEALKRVPGLRKVAKAISKEKAGERLERYVDFGKAPSYVPKILESIQEISKGSYEALKEFQYRSLMIGIMHFMGPRDFDLQRLQRCQIHYPTLDGKLIPFCKGNLPKGAPGITLQDVKEKYKKI
jgi:hypothetical protein